MSNNRSQRVFISYSYADREMALKISDALDQEDIRVFIDYKDISAGENVFDQIRYMYESSETVIILLSDSLFTSDYFQHEFPEYFFEEARKRKINIIPVLLKRSKIPSEFLEYEIINLTNNFEKGIQRVIQKLKVIPEISFEHFSAVEFEEFTYDLLKEFRFKNIHSNNNRAFDLVAESYAKDIFGIPSKETWLIEIKFYKEERFSLNSLMQIVSTYHNSDSYEDAKVLLVTNSILTSVAEDFINDIKHKEKIDIRVLDGAILKKIISKRKRILKKYFLR